MIGLSDWVAGILSWVLLQMLILVAALVVVQILAVGDSTDFVMRTQGTFSSRRTSAR